MGESSSSSGGKSGSSGRGGNSSKGNSDSSNNQVVTQQGGVAPQPKNLLDAISEIQQFYVIESTGKNIPKAFFTIVQTMEFMKIGASSGFKEGMMLALFLPVIELFFIPFILKNPDIYAKIFFCSISYLAIVFNSILCVYVSRYYIGVVTRKAINTVFVGRGLMLVLKAGLIYFVWAVISKMMARPTSVWAVAKHFGTHAETVYYDILTIQPQILPIVQRGCLVLGIAATIPYLAAFAMDRRKQAKIQRNKERVMGDAPT